MRNVVLVMFIVFLGACGKMSTSSDLKGVDVKSHGRLTASTSLALAKQDICGDLETDGNLWLTPDGSGERGLVAADFEPPFVQADYAKMIALTNQLFAMTGDRVCISQVKAYVGDDTPGFNLTRDSVITLAPDFKIIDIKAGNCEIFVDKAAVIYQDGYGEHNQIHYPVGSLQLFVKVLPDHLDGVVRSVRFYGKVHGGDSWVQAVALPSWRGARDYFNFSMTEGMQGAFYVETDRNTRYWLNFKQQVGADFAATNSLFETVDSAVGFFGYKYPQHGPELDVDSIAKTADVLPLLNPQMCR